MLLNRGEEDIDVRLPNRSLTEEEFKQYTTSPQTCLQAFGMWMFWKSILQI